MLHAGGNPQLLLHLTFELRNGRIHLTNDPYRSPFVILHRHRNAIVNQDAVGKEGEVIVLLAEQGRTVRQGQCVHGNSLRQRLTRDARKLLPRPGVCKQPVALAEPRRVRVRLHRTPALAVHVHGVRGGSHNFAPAARQLHNLIDVILLACYNCPRAGPPGRNIPHAHQILRGDVLDGAHRAVCQGHQGTGRKASPPQPQDEVKRTFSPDVVLREGHSVLQLLSREDEALLVGRDPLLVLDLFLQLIYRRERRDVHRDCLPRQSFYVKLKHLVRVPNRDANRWFTVTRGEHLVQTFVTRRQHRGHHAELLAHVQAQRGRGFRQFVQAGS
mmetsp:Transcript_9778/g.27472  ORF Transcript_9778/g.27472 Transcript_9778/m.27472 type:complete len:329 (+) Transcript_9778:1187-2173(+)